MNNEANHRGKFLIKKNSQKTASASNKGSEGTERNEKAVRMSFEMRICQASPGAQVRKLRINFKDRS